MIYTFFIQDLYDTTEIEEPKGWKDLMSELDRPFETHGIFFSYAGGGDDSGTVFKLGFSCEASTLLEAAYQIDGSEAFYQFGVDEAPDTYTAPTTIFLGEIDFKTRGFDEDYWNAEINQITNLVKLKTRAKLRTNFNKQLTHDGIVVSKLNSQDVVLLATKTFRQLRVQQTGITVSDQSSALTDTTVMRGQSGFNITESVELGDFTNIDSIFQFDDVDAFLTLTKSSQITFNVEFDFDLDITEDQGSGTTEYTINLTLLSSKRSKEGENTWPIWVGGTPSGASPFDHSTTAYGSVGNGPLVFYNGDFEAGTSFKLQLFISMGTTGTAQFSVDWTIRNLQLIFVDYRADLGTVAKCYNLHDSLNKTLNFITGEYDYLYSELLGDINKGYDVNGCFSTMRHTNGFRVRQINDDNKAPVASFSDFVDNLNAPGAIGYGIEELESPDVINGEFAITWGVAYANIVEITVLIENLTYDIYIGDKIGFYNSDTLFGTYEVLDIDFSGVILFNTHIYIDVSNNPSLFSKSGTSIGVIITSSNTTSFKDKLRLEKWEHFYGDNELIDLGVIQDYEEEPFDEILYNEFKLGFRKFANDEDKPTTLEDFETKSNWGLPLTNSDQKLSKIMSWIMSTFMINESRGTLFKEKPTTSNKLDNDLFLFDVDDSTIDTTVSFVHNVSSLDTITVNANTYENYIRDTGIFTISGATIGGNDQNYLYDSNLVEHLLPSDTYKIFLESAAVTTDFNDPVTVTGYIFDGTNFVVPVKAEADEKLTSVSGLSGPNYTYNLRRTMKRFLIRWGRFINSVLGYISDSTLTIQNLDYVNNGSLNTDIDTSQVSSDCLMGDNSSASIQEDDNVTTDNFPSAKFKPNFIRGTVKICDDDYAMILAAHKNRLQAPDDIKNYGYCSVTSPRGESKQGWVMNMKRSPVSRTAKVKLIERLPPPPVMVFDGSNYGLIGYHAEFEVQNFEYEWQGTDETGSGRKFGINFNDAPSAFNPSGHQLYDDATFRYYFDDGGTKTPLTKISTEAPISLDVNHYIKIRKYGTTFEFTVDEVTDNLTLTETIIFDNTDAETPVGCRWLGGAPANLFAGTMNYCKFKELDGSGNIVNDLIELLAENDNGVTVTNTATDAPPGSDMTWFNI